MKRKKKLALLAGMILICLIITGCGSSASGIDITVPLKQQQEEYAVWQDENTFLYQNQLYHRLPDTDITEYPFFGGISSDFLLICEPDVPLLVRRGYGKYASIHLENGIISYNEFRRGGLYCREDLYDSVSAKLQKPVQLTEYCYFYEADYEMRIYHLTSAQRDAVDETLRGTPVEGEIHNDFECRVELYHISADKIFGDLGCMLYLIDGEYRIVKDGERSKFYPVAEENEEYMKQTMKVVMESRNVFPYPVY